MNAELQHNSLKRFFETVCGINNAELKNSSIKWEGWVVLWGCVLVVWVFCCCFVFKQVLSSKLFKAKKETTPQGFHLGPGVPRLQELVKIKVLSIIVQVGWEKRPKTLFAGWENKICSSNNVIYLVLFANHKVLLLHLHHVCSPNLLNSAPAYKSSCL